MDVTDQVFFEKDVFRSGQGNVPHVVMCKAVSVGLRGTDTQYTCSEMLHWDEYREEFGIQDGTTKMMDAFSLNTELPFKGYTFKAQKCDITAYSVAVNPNFSDSSTQTFCGEMQHWDDYREINNIRDGTPSMKELFYPKVFCGCELYILDSKKRLTVAKSMCIAALRKNFGKDVQPLYTEMLHWDDYQVNNGILPDPKMEDLFGK
ncbi:hypothetical protein LSM04_001210 [Trypanosoma melophagium]|uniref:uncharacterized protein n=1 Tax=Trypanosoma melophagium TaxID=715481 RepID=UPI003519FB89|nr:hypothetical protein LSM04_001210 [Trypanosoma melophagium]